MTDLARLLGMDYHAAYRRLARAQQSGAVEKLPDGTWDVKRQEEE